MAGALILGSGLSRIQASELEAAWRQGGGLLQLAQTALPAPGRLGGWSFLREQPGAQATPGLVGELSVRIGGQTVEQMSPGQPALWGFRFLDARSGAPITQFDSNHHKLMHLIVVSADLERFAHIHPTLGDRGLFTMSVNEPTQDPDNQDAALAVPKAGPYLLFLEVKPKGGKPEELRFGLVAKGSANPAPLQPDLRLPSGEIRKYFKADGTFGQPGDFYQVTLRIDKMSGMVHLGFNIQTLMDHGGHRMYMGVSDLEDWLGMPGHAVLVSQKGNTAQEKVFRHLHAGTHGGDGNHGGHGWHKSGGSKAGPDLMFMLGGGQAPSAGIYKLWGQFKHRGRVLTFPFVIGM